MKAKSAEAVATAADAADLQSCDSVCQKSSPMTTVWSPSAAVATGSPGFSVLCILALVILAAVLGFYVFKFQKLSQKLDSICMTSDCVRAAALIIDKMDLSIDPCEDFYEFSCGNYIKTKSVPHDRSSRNILQEIQDQMYIEMKNLLEESERNDSITVSKAKQFYASCMRESAEEDEAAVADLVIKLINESGGAWCTLETLLGSECRERSFDLEKRLADAFMNQIPSLFNMYVASPDDKNDTKYALHVFAGETILESTYLENATQSPELSSAAEAYIQLQLDILRFLAEKQQRRRTENTGLNERTINYARKEIRQLLDFEVDLAILVKSFSSNSSLGEGDVLEEMKNNISKAELFSIEGMNRDFPFMDWRKSAEYLEQQSTVPITHMYVQHKEYLQQLSGLLARHSAKTVDNYLCWSYLARFLPYASTGLRKIYEDFRKEVPEPADGDSPAGASRVFLAHWEECVHLTCEGLRIPSAVAYLTSKREKLADLTGAVTEMIANIKTAFHHIIDHQNWLLSQETKDLLKERVNHIKTKIGFPDFLFELQRIDQTYKSLDVDQEDVFLANVMRITHHEMQADLAKLNETVDPEKEWLMQPLISNAYYDASSDNIILPVGILRDPLIAVNRPKFLDYSTLGVVIGHEMAHSMDKLTRKEKSRTGNITWWSDENEEAYNREANCFSEQFSSFSIPTTGESLDGNITLDENVCDFAGFQQAFRAYASTSPDYDVRLPGLSEFTTEHLFFIQYAQVWCEVTSLESDQKATHDSHSPGRFRTQGVTTNSPQFARIFNCKANSPMNPDSKCRLWSDA